MAGAEWQFSIQCQVSPAMYFFSCLFFMGRGCLETKRGSNLAPSLLCVFTLVWCNPLALFEMTQVSKPVMSESAGCILRPASELVFTEKLISKGSGPAAQASACRTLPEHKKKRGEEGGDKRDPWQSETHNRTAGTSQFKVHSLKP